MCQTSVTRFLLCSHEVTRTAACGRRGIFCYRRPAATTQLYALCTRCAELQLTANTIPQRRRASAEFLEMAAEAAMARAYLAQGRHGVALNMVGVFRGERYMILQRRDGSTVLIGPGRGRRGEFGTLTDGE